MILLKVLETPAVSMTVDRSPIYIIDDKGAIAEAVSAYMEEHPVLAEEQDPTVPDWAKRESKPAYSAEEIGADPAGAAAEALKAAVDYTDQRIGSASGGVDSAVVEERIAAHNTAEEAHGDLRLLVAELAGRLNALADSDDTTLDQLSEVVTYIKNNRSLIEQITTGKVSVTDIVDNLTTPAAARPLSAKQGVVLKEAADALAAAVAKKLDASALSGAVETALEQAKASGDFDGVTPDIQVGTVTTLPSGTDAAVWRDPDSPDSAPVFHFGIPAGSSGSGGDLPDGVPFVEERAASMTFAQTPEHHFDVLGYTWWKVFDLVPKTEEILNGQFATSSGGAPVTWNPTAAELLVDTETVTVMQSAEYGMGFAICRATGEHTVNLMGMELTVNIPATGIYFGYTAEAAVPASVAISVAYPELHKLDERLLPAEAVRDMVNEVISEALGGEY